MLALGLARLTAARLPLLQISALDWSRNDHWPPNVAFWPKSGHGRRPHHLDERDELQLLVLQISIDCPWHQQFFSNHNKTVKDHPKHT